MTAPTRAFEIAARKASYQTDRSDTTAKEEWNKIADSFFVPLDAELDPEWFR